MADAALLDRYLAAYGPEAQDARELLRHGLASRLQARWPAEDFGPKEPAPPSNRRELLELEQRILHLAPRDDSQKWYQIPGTAVDRRARPGALASDSPAARIHFAEADAGDASCLEHRNFH
jgi:hypothetical protein